MTSEVGSCWPKGHNLNILGRSLLDDATNIKTLDRVISDNIFFNISSRSIFSLCDLDMQQNRTFRQFFK